MKWPFISISYPRTLLRQQVHELRRIADALDRAYPPPLYSAKDIHEPIVGRFDMAEEAQSEREELDREWLAEQARMRRGVKTNKREDS